jgi:hypothetical protein
MSRCRALGLAGALLFATVIPVLAETAPESRVALIIGNAAYKAAPLKNPINDARAMGRALKTVGFDVTVVNDGDQKALKRAILEFSQRLAKGGVGLFYYSGHGLQVKGNNYLVPVDADIRSEAHVEVEAVNVSAVLAQMDEAKTRVNIVILDACRDNPFARRFRSTARGLASIDAPSGTLIAYATAPGSVADDGTGDNGLYTEELLKVLPTPGLKVEEVFKRVLSSVKKRSEAKQIPWVASSLDSDFSFSAATVPLLRGGDLAAAPTALLATPADPAAVEIAYWNSIKDSTDPTFFAEYLRKYPNGHFASIARSRRLELERRAAAPDPREIERQVRQKLDASGLVLAIDVSTDGIVTLKGVVRSPESRALAIDAARVPGVRDVRSQINVQQQWKMQ